MRYQTIRAVLWDIDGTLLDSEPHHFRSIAAVCARHGHVVAESEFERLLGNSMAAVHAMLDAVRPMPIDLPAFARACTRHYVENVDAVEPRPGALERVDWLAARGLAQACVSNSGRPVVEANIARMARPCLSFGISRDDVEHGKPHPEPYLKAAARLGLEPAQCLVVEDSPVGARAAKAAGMVTVAWPQRPDLVFDEVDHLVGDPAGGLDALDWEALLDGVAHRSDGR
jgi:beta-phosphoglucomutase-like phosphatase (HAD superfamily)